MALDPECRPSLFPYHLNETEWEYLHSDCLRQLLAGVVYRAICHLPKDQKPPMELIYQWASEAEVVKGQNKLLNSKAAQLSQQFALHNHKTAILKGPANARLYPDPLNIRVHLWPLCALFYLTQNPRNSRKNCFMLFEQKSWRKFYVEMDLVCLNF